MKQAISRKNLWERTPPSCKAMMAVMLGVVPAYVFLGRRFRQTLRFLCQAQWWPVEETREYQVDQLRSICTLAYQETSYYRRTFDEAGVDPAGIRQPEDIHGMPTIDKDVVREHLDEMCAVPASAPNVDYVATGGSTGLPLRFYIGADRSAIEYAYLIASWQRIGYRLDIPQVVFRGQFVEEDRRGLRHSYDPLLRRHYYSNFHMRDDNIRRYLEHVGTVGPCYLHAYPSSAYALASCIDRLGLEGPRNIRGILAGSENVLAHQRALTERVFGVPYFSWYGHSEKLVLGAECEHSSQYHIWPTYGYFELLDSEGRQVTEPGGRGEIVGTGFINRVMPFIRYRTGDYAILGEPRCSACGREHQLLREIEGRWPQGGLIAHDGSVVSLTAVNVHDDTLEHVVGYQFYQNEPGRAVFRVVPARPLTPGEQSVILDRMNRRLQGQVKLTLEIRAALQQTSAGKILRVIQDSRTAEAEVAVT